MAKYSKQAERFIGSKIEKMMREGMPQKQAVAAAHSIARKKKLKVPEQK